MAMPFSMGGGGFGQDDPGSFGGGNPSGMDEDDWDHIYTAAPTMPFDPNFHPDEIPPPPPVGPPPDSPDTWTFAGGFTLGGGVSSPTAHSGTLLAYLVATMGVGLVLVLVSLGVFLVRRRQQNKRRGEVLKLLRTDVDPNSYGTVTIDVKPLS